jgi:hypothetical protein
MLCGKAGAEAQLDASRALVRAELV